MRCTNDSSKGKRWHHRRSKVYGLWLAMLLIISALTLSACSYTTPGSTSAPVQSTPATEPVGTASAAIEIKNFSFNPRTLQVAVGTKVTWTNKDGVSHSTTSDTGVWDSRLLSKDGSFSYTFTKAGTYPYYCQPHGGPGGKGMSGVIIVN